MPRFLYMLIDDHLHPELVCGFHEVNAPPSPQRYDLLGDRWRGVMAIYMGRLDSAIRLANFRYPASLPTLGRPRAIVTDETLNI